ncbi:DUF1850 domain-containing protein [Nonomuraea sp. NPDC050328]|uniref:DUF1850 domain-containing protein n=1 Tax=Nonomuraea sp. NPDC050328 TaxID=3364361 RepID=UPI00378D66B5
MIRLLLVLTLAAAALAGSGGGRPSVYGLALPPDGRFALTYVHSVYKAPSADLFQVHGRRFTMYAAVSTSGGVLDYYALEGRRESLPGGVFRLTLDSPATYESLDLLATSLGRRTLHAGGRCLALYPETGAAAVRLAPGRTFDGRGEPCPAYSRVLFTQ